MILRSIAATALTLLAAAQTGSRERTSIFVCGTDQTLPVPIPVTWGNIVLAGDGRMYMACIGLPGQPKVSHPPEDRENRERTVIFEGIGRVIGVASPVAVVGAARIQNPVNLENRWRAAQALARLEREADVGYLRFDSKVAVACNAVISVFNQDDGQFRWHPGFLFFMSRDTNSAVRKEAVYAIGVRLSSAARDYSENFVTAAAEEMRACARAEKDSEIVGVWLDGLGAVRYKTPKQVSETEAFLIQQTDGFNQASPVKVLGAAKGLEALIRQNPDQTWSERTIVRLRQLSAYGPRNLESTLRDSPPRVRRLAMMALRSAEDFDMDTLRAAALDADWQVRRLVAMSLRLNDREHKQLADTLAGDFAFQVRYELMSAHQRLAVDTGVCAPIARFFKDDSPAVVMRAMDALPAECSDLEDIVPALDALAEKLSRGESHTDWHVPSRALAALARLNADKARPWLAFAVSHPVWQVRAAAAATAVTLKDESVVVTLARDREPNVRTDALNALFQLKSPELAPSAIESLKSMTDYQLLLTAAIRLRGTPEELRDEAASALGLALARISAQETDTSRDTRVAIIERLAEIVRPERSAVLMPYVADYDDAVREAAGKALVKVVGSAPETNPQRRYPYQPPEAALYELPRQAIIDLESGTVTLDLLREVAPVTIARFVALAKQGFYNDRTFHRVVPNFVVQGGSPAANEYAGTSRFMRDEVGLQAAHVRGAVGISTRGRDTGDGQIFIDLVDLPRLDREYTVFAYVTHGMELVDKMLDGAKIVGISFR